jgi:hypothetical protein
MEDDRGNFKVIKSNWSATKFFTNLTAGEVVEFLSDI